MQRKFNFATSIVNEVACEMSHRVITSPPERRRSPNNVYPYARPVVSHVFKSSVLNSPEQVHLPTPGISPALQRTVPEHFESKHRNEVRSYSSPPRTPVGFMV